MECRSCKFYADEHCRRFPRPLAVDSEHWCGEFRKATNPRATRPAHVRVPDGLATPSFLTAWNEWVEYRRATKHPLSPISAKQQLERCLEWGPERAVAAIRFSIGNGYQGLFEPRSSNRPVPVPKHLRTMADYY